ncbi:MAG TPA: septum site-determining protein MinD, partial [Sulfurivirga caldicuralii]|nr:septum site-determining protein MinD [Sulfurivirga caldicuralii]
EALVVTNPEVSSVRDSDRILGILQSKSQKAEQGEQVKEHLVLSRYNPERVEAGEMMAWDDIVDLLGVPLLGVVPESEDVLNASNAGIPVIREKGSNAAAAYEDIVARFFGDERPQRFLTVEKKGLLKKLFGG